MSKPKQKQPHSGTGQQQGAAARARFERLKRLEQRLREQITDFSASHNLPRDELYRRGADDPTRERGN